MNCPGHVFGNPAGDLERCTRGFKGHYYSRNYKSQLECSGVSRGHSTNINIYLVNSEGSRLQRDTHNIYLMKFWWSAEGIPITFVSAVGHQKDTLYSGEIV